MTVKQRSRKRCDVFKCNIKNWLHDVSSRITDLFNNYCEWWIIELHILCWYLVFLECLKHIEKQQQHNRPTEQNQQPWPQKPWYEPNRRFCKNCCNYCYWIKHVKTNGSNCSFTCKCCLTGATERGTPHHPTPPPKVYVWNSEVNLQQQEKTHSRDKQTVCAQSRLLDIVPSSW